MFLKKNTAFLCPKSIKPIETGKGERRGWKRIQLENTDEISGYASVFGNVDDGGGYSVPEVYANENYRILEF